jgi:molybdopterin synthase catalytic subunit
MTAFTLSPDPIDPARLALAMEDHRAGALVTFTGQVRRQNAAREVTRLDYEAFGPLARKEGDRILKEAVTRFAILSAVCVHRTGSLELGEPAVWIGVLAPHREAAFDACRMIIDEVKKRVPIWKKEHYAEGDSGWIQPDRPPTA